MSPTFSVHFKQPQRHRRTILTNRERVLSHLQCIQKIRPLVVWKIRHRSPHRPPATICKKPLHKAPARLQKMLMRLQRFCFTIKYKKGTSLHLADTFSRAALPTPVHARITGLEVFRAELTEDSGTHNPRLTETTESCLRDETKKDEPLSKLMTTIVQGWLYSRNQVPQPLRPYWPYRDELTIDNGLIYEGAQVMIPQSMQAEMLLKIRTNHFGPESNIRMGREVLFWPGMRQAYVQQL